mmetsp:Transcript_10431/g.34294  ORF Transcript_10431/g.34294 Transcript_10431/m.34294 type:complete len:228 (-) Transcript_10431:1351-2034(-)
MRTTITTPVPMQPVRNKLAWRSCKLVLPNPGNQTSRSSSAPLWSFRDDCSSLTMRTLSRVRDWALLPPPSLDSVVGLTITCCTGTSRARCTAPTSSAETRASDACASPKALSSPGEKTGSTANRSSHGIAVALRAPPLPSSPDVAAGSIVTFVTRSCDVSCSAERRSLSRAVSSSTDSSRETIISACTRHPDPFRPPISQRPTGVDVPSEQISIEVQLRHLSDPVAF